MKAVGPKPKLDLSALLQYGNKWIHHTCCEAYLIGEDGLYVGCRGQAGPSTAFLPRRGGQLMPYLIKTQNTMMRAAFLARCMVWEKCGRAVSPGWQRSRDQWDPGAGSLPPGTPDCQMLFGHELLCSFHTISLTTSIPGELYILPRLHLFGAPRPLCSFLVRVRLSVRGHGTVSSHQDSKNSFP